MNKKEAVKYKYRYAAELWKKQQQTLRGAIHAPIDFPSTGFQHVYFVFSIHSFFLFLFSFNRNRNHKCFLFPIRLLNNKWDDAFKSARNDKYLFPFAIGFKDETFHVKNTSFFPSLSLLLCFLFFCVAPFPEPREPHWKPDIHLKLTLNNGKSK